MSADSQSAPYQCPKCGASGELPLVDGDTWCPECGEHLWSLPEGSSGQRRSEARSRFGPAGRLAVRDGRPPLETRGLWFVRFRVVLFRPIVILWIILRQRIMVSRVDAKLEQVTRCESRAELEQLLGEPLYAVDAKAVGREGFADVIECYESEGCCIDLWFKDDRLANVSGFVKPTLWDMVLAGHQP
jgi:uncharacterized Zn finger protein (UPF0148 family)